MGDNLNTNGSTASPLVLAAEDDEFDAFILKRVFERIATPSRLVIVSDGQEAVDYLHGEGSYADRLTYPLPALLLLDLKMPRMNGFDVLAWLSERSQFKNLPVIVLSASCHETDIQKARQMGAWQFCTKPMAFEQSVELIENLLNRWLRNPRSASIAAPETRY
jgi:CheY-like chemotaxis protein